MFKPIRITKHRGNDDLLTAGLGLAGLRNVSPPTFEDAHAPTPAELRRRALWSNWRGLVDLSAEGGYGRLYGSVANVPGREFSALVCLPGAQQPHRVLVQVPDDFDTGRRCVVVAASSGSRGIYGAVPVAGAWALPKGCAVAYTDKGAGSDYFDLDAQAGFALDGTSQPLRLSSAFAPDTPAAAGQGGVAIKHAHSRDNPEADWGRHVHQAAQFALHALNQALPDQAPFDFSNTRIIAAGLSNGGGAALRAAEIEDGDWLDAVVAAAPNVHVEGGRALYDYSTQAALLMPCALLALDDVPASPLTDLTRNAGALRCASLAAAGALTGNDVAEQASAALSILRDSGWTDAALRGGASSVEWDVWRSIVVTYASAYGRYGVGEHPCGYTFATQNADGSPRAATPAERASRWCDASGIALGAGIGLIDTNMTPPDITLSGLQGLRGLWAGDSEAAQRVRAGIADTRAALPRPNVPIIIIHGLDDGLVPAAFSSTPYVAAAQADGGNVRYWQVHNAQHFDAFLARPDYRARYVPLLPYLYAALDSVMAQLDGVANALPVDAVIAASAPVSETLDASHLQIPTR